LQSKFIIDIQDQFPYVCRQGVVFSQRQSHVHLQKRIRTAVLKLTVPAQRPIKRSTLAHILKQTRLSLEAFQELL